MELCCTRNGNDPWLLGEQPCERNLRRAWPFPLRDLVQQIHQSLICFQSLRREARQNASEVGAVELRVLLNLAGQESLAERAVGNEADSQLLQRRQHFLLRIA